MQGQREERTDNRKNRGVTRSGGLSPDRAVCHAQDRRDRGAFLQIFCVQRAPTSSTRRTFPLCQRQTRRSASPYLFLAPRLTYCPPPCVSVGLREACPAQKRFVGIVRAALPPSLSCLLHLDARRRQGEEGTGSLTAVGSQRAKRERVESAAVLSFTFVKSLGASGRPCCGHTSGIWCICVELAHMSCPPNSLHGLLSSVKISRSSSEQAAVCSSTASSGARVRGC